MVSAGVMWLAIAAIVNLNRDSGVTIKKEDRRETPIKQEPIDESTSPLESSLDTSNDRPESSIKKERVYQADDESDGSPGDQTSGAGTGLESSGAPGVQRRRRHMFGDGDFH